MEVVPPPHLRPKVICHEAPPPPPSPPPPPPPLPPRRPSFSLRGTPSKLRATTRECPLGARRQTLLHIHYHDGGHFGRELYRYVTVLPKLFQTYTCGRRAHPLQAFAAVTLKLPDLALISVEIERWEMGQVVAPLISRSSPAHLPLISRSSPAHLQLISR